MTDDDRNRVTLREFAERILAEHREYENARWAAHHREHEVISRALDKAECAMASRLESMNEFRAQLNRQAETFVTQKQHEPLVAFVNRFWGVILGLMAANAVITWAIIEAIKGWSKT
jgi:hypothetical protein